MVGDLMINLKAAISAVQENNQMNKAKWSDWPDGAEILERYEITADKEVMELLDRAVRSNGRTLCDDYAAIELRELGQNFSPCFVCHQEHTAKKKYEIINLAAGVSWGVFEGETELDAYLEMLRDAGYDENSLPPGEKAWDEIEISDNFKVREIDA